MAFTARLFVLLAITIPILALIDDFPNEFPTGNTQHTDIDAILEQIKDSCPPFGHPDNKFKVTVLGTKSPAIGGCASMVPPNSNIISSFNLWLGSAKTGGGRCGEKNMDHYIFECISKYPFLTKEETLEGWYIMLYDRTAQWSGHQDHRCALYQTVHEDPPMIQMVISANQSCEGLSNIQQSAPTVPKGSRHFSDGSVALLFSKDLPQTVVWRKKRSEEEGGGCRFPDWSQGSWTDLKVDENLIRYEPAFHEKDDVDYSNDNEDGKDGDAETTGGEQYMKRSQRHAPVGISGIDHPSSHNSGLHRGRRSIPYINTVKMFRKPNSTVQNNTLDKYWKKHQLYNDNMRNFDLFNYRYEEKETNKEKRRCYCYTDSEIFTPKNDKDQMELFNKVHKYSQTTQKYPEDLNQKSKNPFDIVEFRKKRELGDQDVKEDTNHGQKRNYSYRDFEPYILGDMDIPKILHEKNTFSTKKKTTNLNKKLYPFDIVQRKEKSVKQLLNYNEENINKTKEICFCYDDVEGFLPKNYEIINKLINEMTKFLTMTRKHPRDLKEKSKFPFNFSKIRKKRESNNQNDHGTEGMKHRQKRCLFTETKSSTERYRDKQFENPKTGDPTEPSSKPITYFGTTEDPTARYIRQRSIFEDDVIEDDNDEAVKKMKIAEQQNKPIRWFNIMRLFESIKNNPMLQPTVDIKHDHGMDGIKHRQKRCLFTETKTSTERYRDKQFENPKTGDPTEPSSKPITYFGTTEDPTARYIRQRSIFEDDVIEDDNDEAVKKMKIAEQQNKPIRWFNIMRLFESIRNNPMLQPTVDIKHDHGMDGIKHRKKRCLFTETKSSTEQYRDKQFENPKTGDPTEPSSKPKTYFGTTEDPTARYIRQRSIFEDDVIEGDNDEAVKKMKITEQQNKPIRWFNIMRLFESIRNNPMLQPTVDIKHDHGMDGIKHRKKRCLFTETKSSTEQYRDKQFENPKTGDPTEPSSKPKTYFGTTEDPTARYIRPRSISEDQIIVDDEEEALKKIKIIDQFNRHMRWLNIMRAIESAKNHRMQQSNVDIKHDHGTEGMKHRQKRCLFTETKSSTERYRDKQFENPKTGDPTEPSSKPITYFGTTEDPTARNIRPRSIFEDEVIEDDDDEAVKKMKMTKWQNRRIRWFNIMRVVESIRNNPMLQPNRNTEDEEYKVIPENTKLPPAVRYLKHAESQGIPYIQALFNWRSMERAYRQRIAEVAYTAFPGQIHPDIVMEDFDQTYDGIEYDFNPWYPEGTIDDPTAYRALTLPGGYKLEPRLSRRPTFEQEHSSDAPESATIFSPIRVADINYSTDQENTSSLNQRMRRSSPQLNQQQHARTTFTWRCEMAVDNDVNQLPQQENGAKFLTYGGRVVENNEMSGNDQHNEQESKMSYGCLWLVPRGPNILEFSIIGTGMPLKNQSMQTFAQQLCSGNHGHRKDTSVRNEKKLRLHRPSWVTETRTDDKKRVPVRCPVPPGIVFYGVVPAPPPPSTVFTNKDQPAPLRLCAKLVSSADDCTAGQMGPADQMKYTVSECVDQDSSTGTSQTMVAQQTIFEASRGYTIGGSWRRNKRHSATTDTSTIASYVATTSTSSNIPISPFSSHNPSIRTIDNITDQTIGSTTTILSPMTPSSMISSSTEIQPLLGITTIDTKNVTTTTATTLLTGTASILPLSSPQERTTPERQLPSLSKSSTTTTSPSTSTVSVTTSSSYHQVPDYYYRQQQQWQQQHQQPNNNNNDYYYRGRQQQYPPPLPGSTGMDNNYYYIQQQQQQQHSQTQPHWLPEQHPIATNDYSNGYQHQTMGGYRTGDYYYRQQQQNYHNHQHNNNRQQKILQPPRNSSLTYQYPNGGSWNVHGDRPLYISSSGGGDNNRDTPVAWNSSTSISSSNNGGWTTAAQQHWWYQQQQQQQLQQQQRQHQNNRGLGGILSLQPVPLPPLHTEQGAVTISMPTPQPLNPRRQMKPPNHYYLPTLTTKTSYQPYQLRPKSESRYYQEREYQCLGQWTEPQQHISPVAGEKPVMLTYTYLKRLSPVSKEGAQYECFVGTPIPNDEGLNPETTTTILLTEAGTNTKCSRLSDPYRSGMKLVGTKIKKEGACKGYAQPVHDSTGGSWYSLKPQPISPSIPSAENGGGAWYAAPPVPVVAVQGPTTMMPILTGRHTGGNGHTFTSSHNEQNRRPQSANLPPHKNHSFRAVADKIIVILAVILFTARRFFN